MSDFELGLAELRSRPGTKWHKYADDVIPAWIADMDFLVAEPIQARMRQIVAQGAYGYEDGSLQDSLAEAFGTYMLNRFGWRVDGGHVIAVADLVQALFSAVGAFSEPGDRVVMQTPIYPPFINAARDMGRQVVEHDLVDDGSRFVLDASSFAVLFDNRTRLLLLCNPHNPTGRVFVRQELEAIAAVAVERDLVVVADEVHADLAYPGNEHIPFATLGAEVARRTVTITSATKAYNIPGLRCGVMHFGSPRLFARFRAVFPERLLGKVNRLGIEATLCAWSDCAPYLERVRGVLLGNRDRVARFLAGELPGVKHYPPEASFLAWLDCHQLDLRGSPHAFFLEQARVALSDGDEFGTHGFGHVRLNFGTSASILDEVLMRMAAAVRARQTIS